MEKDEFYVKAQIAQLYELKAERAKAIAEIELAIAQLQALCDRTAAPYDFEIDTVTGDVVTATLELGCTVEADVGVARYTRGYTKVSYDSKKLDGYAAANPEVLEFRKVTEVKPRVKVTV